MAKTSRKASRRSGGKTSRRALAKNQPPMDPRERSRRLRELGRVCCVMLTRQALGHNVDELADDIRKEGEELWAGGATRAEIERVKRRAEDDMWRGLKKLTGVDVRKQPGLIANPTTIPLSRGKHALVSPQDHSKLSKHSWYCGHRGYAMRSKLMPNGSRKTVSMHREILGAKDNEEVDHINRNRLDNRRENLRILGHSANLHNRGAYGSSGVAGVSWDMRKNKWRAEIGKNGKRAWLGYHATKADAERAYKSASAKIYTGKDKASR